MASSSCAVGYILRCDDNSLCVGHTNDLAERPRRHRAGLAASYTAARLPVDLVYRDEREPTAEAVQRERQITRWSGAKKDALARGDRDTLTTLAKRRRPRTQTREIL